MRADRGESRCAVARLKRVVAKSQCRVGLVKHKTPKCFASGNSRIRFQRWLGREYRMR